MNGLRDRISRWTNSPTSSGAPTIRALSMVRRMFSGSLATSMPRRAKKSLRRRSASSRLRAITTEPSQVTQISERWGTRDCQRYLESLLRDNREGTREGFPLPVVDDILLLAAVLDLQLGPLPPAAA